MYKLIRVTNKQTIRSELVCSRLELKEELDKSIEAQINIAQC